MNVKRKFPTCVPDPIIGAYIELSEWVGPKSARLAGVDNSPRDRDLWDFKESLRDEVDCLREVILAPTMRSAWKSLDKRSDKRHCRQIVQAITRNAYLLANPKAMGSLDSAERLSDLSRQLKRASKSVSLILDLNAEYFEENAEMGADGSKINVSLSELREWFAIPPEDALEGFCDWLDRKADLMEEFAREDTKQPRSKNASTHKLIRDLSRLMYRLYERPLDDVVAALAETMLAHFGSSEIISRERVINLRTPPE